MRYFITGATGFVGGQVARQLRAAGHEVVALVRNPAGARGLTEIDVSVHPGDITDRESLRAPMTGVDGIFHIAAWYRVGTRDKQLAERINVQGTRNVLEVMRELGIPRGVYTSTLAVFSDTGGKVVDETYRHGGPWLTEYDRTKWLAHYEVALPMMADGLPLVIVQPGVVYGPGDIGVTHDLWVQYLTRRLPVAPRGTAYCWGHIDDMARGHILGMDNGRTGESYIIAGPVHTLVEALAMAERITGVRAPRLHPGPGLLKALAAVTGVVERVVPLPPTYSAEALRVTAGTTYLGSSAKAQRELGFSARPLAEGLPNTLRYEMERLGMRPTGA